MKNDMACFILTHGDLGNCLKRISEKLVTSTIPLTFYSNHIKTIEEIEKEIITDIEKNEFKKALLFVDLAGGSCWMLANRIKKNNQNFSVISGVNIPMLVSFQVNCLRLSWDELLGKIVEDAVKGITTR